MTLIDSRILAKESRISTLKMITDSTSSHLGSSLSVIDMLAVLYSYKINNSRERDSILLSKGHAAAALYSILGNCGLVSSKILETYCQNGSLLGGHISHFATSWIEFSTGSLGHALPFAAGKAFNRKLLKDESKIFVVMSDGELDEGSNWESLLFASHHKLSNLCVLIDRNRLQSIKSTEDTLALEPLDKKLNSFGWVVAEIDGHNHDEILKEIDFNTGTLTKPKIIVCRTIKGKGISFMENDIKWHYKFPNSKEFLKALQELNDKK